MPRKSQSIVRLAEERLDAGAHASAVWVDLQLEFRDERDDEVLGVFGGRWDRQLRAYVGEAETSRVIRLHVGQVEPALWFDDWMADYLAEERRPDRVFDCACTGGRRGGKSAFVMSAAVAFAVSVPDSIVWIVTPSDAFFTEPIAYMHTIMPREWYTELGWPHWSFFLPNGSVIMLRSGHTARRMKQGQCDFAVLNEGQAIPSQSYTTLSASIVDTGGLIMSASNPPDVGDPGEWVGDLVAGINNGTVSGEHFFFDPELNPHIDLTALRALAAKMDSHTYDVQVRGMFLLHPDAVLHSWDRKHNELPVPDIKRDVTAIVTQRKEGRAYDDIVGVDVQNFPWIAAVRCRFYENPSAPGDVEEALLWGCGEAFVEAGDEVDCARELHSAGCSYDRTQIITDASCRWQQQQRDERKQRPEYKGAGSMDMFRGAGFRHVMPPDDNMDSNPLIIDRVRAANARIGSRDGARRVFVDPVRCKRTVESVRKWKTVKSGQPSRHSRAAHGGDALSYIIWRYFPRRVDRGNVDVQSIKRFAGKTRLKGF